MDWIKANRVRLGISQNDLSMLLGYNRSLIVKWESGQRMPSLEQLSSLEKIFGITYKEKPKYNKTSRETITSDVDNDLVCFRYEHTIARKLWVIIVFGFLFNMGMLAYSVWSLMYGNGLIEGLIGLIVSYFTSVLGTITVYKGYDRLRQVRSLVWDYLLQHLPRNEFIKISSYSTFRMLTEALKLNLK